MKRSAAFGVAVLALAMCTTTQAGVVQRMKAGENIVIAHRESSAPFSFVDADKKPLGYSVDICLKLAAALRKNLGANSSGVDFLMVNSYNRTTVLEQGQADMECGSTTNNAQRRKKVAFTVPHFISGVRLLVRADSKTLGLDDLRGKKIAATQGSDTLKLLETLNRNTALRFSIVPSTDHGSAISLVEDGKADAFALDTVLLHGLIAKRSKPSALKVVGKFLTTEPIAIMLPKNDPGFKKLVDAQMHLLIRSGEINTIYAKWFTKPSPPDKLNLKLPVSNLLRDFWKYPSDIVPF